MLCFCVNVFSPPSLVVNLPEPSASTETGVPSGAVTIMYKSFGPVVVILFSSRSKEIRTLSTFLALAVSFSLPPFFSCMPKILKFEACNVEPMSIRSSRCLIIVLAESKSCRTLLRSFVTTSFSCVSTTFCPFKVSICTL